MRDRSIVDERATSVVCEARSRYLMDSSLLFDPRSSIRDIQHARLRDPSSALIHSATYHIRAAPRSAITPRPSTCISKLGFKPYDDDLIPWRANEASAAALTFSGILTRMCAFRQVRLFFLNSGIVDGYVINNTVNRDARRRRKAEISSYYYCCC